MKGFDIGLCCCRSPDRRFCVEVLRRSCKVWATAPESALILRLARCSTPRYLSTLLQMASTGAMRLFTPQAL